MIFTVAAVAVFLAVGFAIKRHGPTDPKHPRGRHHE